MEIYWCLLLTDRKWGNGKIGKIKSLKNGAGERQREAEDERKRGEMERSHSQSNGDVFKFRISPKSAPQESCLCR